MSTHDPHDIIAGLSKPFSRSQIKSRKVGGGRSVDYVSGQSVLNRLNTVAAEWSMQITDRWKEPLLINRFNKETRKSELTEVECMYILAEMTIPGVGTRPGMGAQVIEPGAGEDPMKGALTDAIKNCAKQFGVALDLYGDDTYEHADSGDAPAPPVSREDAPQATERPQEVLAQPERKDYSEEDAWKKASRTLHATAKNVIGGDDPHQALHLMAEIAGFPSLKNMPVPRLLKLNEFIQSDGFDTYYAKSIRPRLPQPKQEAMA